MMVGIAEKRLPYAVNRGSGYSNPDYRWRWACPVCPFTCEERELDDCQARADAHDCGAGWCPVNVPLLCAIAAVAHGSRRLDPTPDDRRRWAERRRLTEVARRTVDRVVPFPGGAGGRP